jgi:hypothetical protein
MYNVEMGISLQNLFYHRKGNQMIASKKDGEFLGRKDPSDRFPNHGERKVFFSEREFQVSHIMETQLAQISLQIGAVGFNSPRPPPDGRRTKTGSGAERGGPVKRTPKNNGRACRERSICRDESGLDNGKFHWIKS